MKTRKIATDPAYLSVKKKCIGNLKKWKNTWKIGEVNMGTLKMDKD